MPTFVFCVYDSCFAAVLCSLSSSRLAFKNCNTLWCNCCRSATMPSRWQSSLSPSGDSKRMRSVSTSALFVIIGATDLSEPSLVFYLLLAFVSNYFYLVLVSYMVITSLTVPSPRITFRFTVVPFTLLLITSIC